MDPVPLADDGLNVGPQASALPPAPGRPTRALDAVQPAARHWSVRLLGGLEVRLGQLAPIKFSRARDKALFAFLAFHADRWHAREALADAWWPGVDTAAALRHLSSALSHLRKALELPDLPAQRVLWSDARRVRLNPEHVVTDVSAFEAALDRAGAVDAQLGGAGAAVEERASLEDALRLYRGDLLPDHYDDWSVAERARLAQRLQWALLTLGELCLQSGEAARALDLARRAAASDPLDEAVARLAMRARLSQGQAARALDDYRRLEARLSRELGLAPDHETQQLARLARRQVDADGVGSGSHAAAPLLNSRAGMSARGAHNAMTKMRLDAAPAARFDIPAATATSGERQVAEWPEASAGEPRLVTEAFATAPAPGGSRGSVGGQLPSPVGDFVGREDELQRLDALVGRPASRLVTITGPGGAGKTRLALEFGRRLDERWNEAPSSSAPATTSYRRASASRQHGSRSSEDGRHRPAERANTPLLAFVGLEQAREAHELLDVAAAALGLVPDDTSRYDQLVGLAGRRRVLLIIDNLEQLLPAAAALVAALLRDAPLLACLVASRRRLGVVGEHELPLAPLAVPSPGSAPEGLVDCPSVRLFGLRAAAADPTFRLHDHIRDVAELCRRLDGLPLALELAAARAAVLSPAEMLQRSDGRVTWPAGLEVDRPARHRTLEATLDWSFNLLPPEHQRLFARLSVFQGGFTLEAAEAVCGELEGEWQPVETPTPPASGEPGPVRPDSDRVARVGAESLPGRRPQRSTRTLDGVEALRNASLIHVVDGLAGRPRRFRLLVMIRSYAEDRLSAIDRDLLPARHAAWFAAVADAGRHRDDNPLPGASLRRIDADLDNIRAALRWFTAAPRRSAEAAALAVALVPYWEQRGLLSEARNALEPLVARLSDGSVDGRAAAQLLEAAGTMAFYQGDVATARERFMAARDEFGPAGDRAAYARVLGALAITARAEGRYDVARGHYREALDLLRSEGHQLAVAKTLYDLGYLEFRAGQPERAAAYFEASLAVLRAEAAKELRRASVDVDDGVRGEDDGSLPSAIQGELAKVRLGLGMVRLEAGELDRAEPLLASSLATFRRLAEPARLAEAELCQGHLARRRGDLGSARRLYLACLERRLAIGERMSLPQVLGALAGIDELEGRPERAVQLAAAAEALRMRHGTIASPWERAAEAPLWERLSVQLGEESFARLWEAGEALSSREAAALARDEQPLRQGASSWRPGPPDLHA